MSRRQQQSERCSLGEEEDRGAGSERTRRCHWTEQGRALQAGGTEGMHMKVQRSQYMSCLEGRIQSCLLTHPGHQV